jgi:hypothetical protein
MSGDSVRVALPLFQTERGGSTPASPLHTKDLIFERCSRQYASELNRIWHSRMPEVEWKTMKYSFHARFGDTTYSVALWSQPVARLLPQQDWIELRRMAIAPDAPKNTASSMLGWMVRWLKRNTKYVKAISYQDTSMHLGTIYRASGWKDAGNFSHAGHNSWNREDRIMFPKSANGSECIDSIKHRWEIDL